MHTVAKLCTTSIPCIILKEDIPNFQVEDASMAP